MRLSRVSLSLALLLVGPACPDDDDDSADDGIEDPTPDDAPGALTNFRVSLSGDDFQLAWTNPADDDLAGALIAIRPAEAPAFTPADGTAHTRGEDLGDDTTVAYIDAGVNATVPVPALGAPFHFAGWAVDLAGQYSDGAATSIDPVPGAPADLAVTVDTDADLTWTPAADADLAGTLVVLRLGEPVAFSPAADTTYSAGEDLGDDQVVVHADLGAEATVELPPIGVPLHFAAWSWDDAGQWSGGATPADATRTRLGEQLATLEYDVDAQTVTVTSQPRDLTLTAAWHVDQARGTEFQHPKIDLTVQNDTGRLLFNLKSVVDAMSDGTQDVDDEIDNGAPGNSGPAPDVSFTGRLWFEDDKPFTYFGPESMLPGGDATRTLTFIHEIAFTGTVTVELRFVDAPAVYGGNRGGDFVVLDTSMSGIAHHRDLTPELERGGPSGDAGEQLRQGVMSLDGRLIYAGEKQTPFVNVIDTSTLEVSGGKDLSTGGLGSVGGVALSPDGATLYVLFNDGAHFHGWSDESGPDTTTVHLLALNASDLSEVSRTTLVTEDPAGRVGQNLSMRPDGGRLAAAVTTRGGTHNELWVLDLPGLGVVDADAETEGAQPLSLPSGEGPRLAFVTYAEAGDVIAATYNNHYQGSDGTDGTSPVDLVNGSDWSRIRVVPEIGGANGGVTAALGGELYYPAREENNRPLSRIAFADGAETPLALWMSPERGVAVTPRATGVVFVPGSDVYWVMSNDRAYAVDAATHELFDADGDAENGTSPVMMGDQMRAHLFVVSPY